MFSSSILAEFDQHAARLRDAHRSRKAAVALKNVVEDREEREAVAVVETLGKRQPSDVYDGDVNLRTLRTLLSLIDDRGWERSAHQLQFHSSFEKCVARVLYKQEWAVSKPAIMKHNSWERCSSEGECRTNSCPVQPLTLVFLQRSDDLYPSAFWEDLLVRTPCPALCRSMQLTPFCSRSIAIFCACLALSMGLEIVIFSPARRASRKLLERVTEFIRVLDCEDRICEVRRASKPPHTCMHCTCSPCCCLREKVQPRSAEDQLLQRQEISRPQLPVSEHFSRLLHEPCTHLRCASAR